MVKSESDCNLHSVNQHLQSNDTVLRTATCSQHYSGTATWRTPQLLFGWQRWLVSSIPLLLSRMKTDLRTRRVAAVVARSFCLLDFVTAPFLLRHRNRTAVAGGATLRRCCRAPPLHPTQLFASSGRSHICTTTASKTRVPCITRLFTARWQLLHASTGGPPTGRRAIWQSHGDRSVMNRKSAST